VRGLISIAAAALTAIAAPAAALAGSPGPTESLGSSHGVEYLRATFDSVVTQAGAAAECDTGDFVLGGGGSIGGDPSTAELSVIAPSSSPDDGWLAEGATTSGARTVTTYAVCGNDSARTDVAVASYPAGSDFSSGEECDPGEVSLSGGVAAGNGDTTIATIRPDFQGVFDWNNRFAVESADTVSRYVVCSSDYARSVKAKPTTVRRDTAAKVVRGCGGGRQVLGGGFEASDESASFLYEVHAISSRPWDDPRDRGKVPEDGWLAKLYNDTGARLTLTAFAVCQT
jgi:hypothetical protein